MLNFYTYNNEAELRAYNPKSANEIIRRASCKKINVSTRAKQCVGSLNGLTYMYADGSQDNGMDEMQYRSECFGNVYMWHG